MHAALRHLIVDEYQDVNPAQERLIELLTGPQVELCVVGDDDQAIYQWRGSDVGNIVEFATRYPGVRTFRITVNRRSRPEHRCCCLGDLSLTRFPGGWTRRCAPSAIPAAVGDR